MINTWHPRKDRPGNKLYQRWRCPPCHCKKVQECQRKKKPLTAKYVERLGMSKEERRRLNQANSAAKRRADWLAAKGWSRNVKTKYGLTQRQYLELLEQQDYQCAVSGCGFVHRYQEWFDLNPSFEEIKGEIHHHHYLLVVDHCHDTGKVRGLLCSQCNLDVGMAEKVAKRGLQLQSLTDYVLASR
jgi:hypothetical protein